MKRRREQAMKVGEVRAIVFARDEGCVAPVIDPEAGPCYDLWGKRIERTDLDHMEMDYVRLRAYDGRHKDPRDHVTACPGHHRGAGPNAGFQWTTSHRLDCRRYLDRQEEA